MTVWQIASSSPAPQSLSRRASFSACAMPLPAFMPCAMSISPLGIGTAAFAVSGAMVAIDKGTDIFGVLLMAVFTALGGGTLRDVLIGHFPPRMFTNFHYVLLACICALAVFIIARIFKERYIERERLIEQVNNVFDAIGLGIFAVSGARIGMEAGFADNIFLTTFLGTTTAVVAIIPSAYAITPFTPILSSSA